MTKKLYLWVFTGDLLSKGLLKSDARMLQIIMPCNPTSPKCVWAENEVDAENLAIKWCEEEIKKNKNWGILKSPQVQVGVEVFGEAVNVNSIGKVLELSNSTIDLRKLVFSTNPIDYSISRTDDVINPQDEYGVKELTEDELADIRRSSFTVIH
ncbi:hypothetical protein [Halalkalibacter urbisdiaboli]|uniref:hypothetical protein n=1 Tax=Halalkalibacter urbisdiaboli TaxID=1960589 RepID=UPI000B42DC0A|nr:hypothetical protein [Halalkalibacter urbisdiaboli]